MGNNGDMANEVGGQQLSRWWMLVNGSNGSVGGHAADNTTMNAWVYQTISATIPTFLQGPYTIGTLKDITDCQPWSDPNHPIRPQGRTQEEQMK